MHPGPYWDDGRFSGRGEGGCVVVLVAAASAGILFVALLSGDKVYGVRALPCVWLIYKLLKHQVSKTG